MRMVRPERFELPTYSSGGCRSILLSYGRTPEPLVYMQRRIAINDPYYARPRLP